MNAPAWLPVILAAVMLGIAAYSLWRLAMSRVLDQPADLTQDAVVFLLALATAGMLVRWMHLLSRGVWALLLGAVGIGLAARAATGRGSSSAAGSVVAASGCAIAVYMLLAGVAPSTIQGSTAGYYTMAGMSDMYKDTTITFPALGIILSVVLAGYAVYALDHIPAPTGTTTARAFASRPLAVCQIAIAVTMAYAILAKLV